MSDEKFDRMIQLLEEILKWVKLEGVQRAKATLTELLQSDSEKIIYENSNGQGSREIATLANVSHVTVVNYWKKWARYGIVEEVRARGGIRYKRIFSLSDFGIEVSRPPSVPSESEIREESSESHQTGQANQHQEGA